MTSHCKYWYCMGCKYSCKHGYMLVTLGLVLFFPVACFLHLDAAYTGHHTQNTALDDNVH